MNKLLALSLMIVLAAGCADERTAGDVIPEQDPTPVTAAPQPVEVQSVSYKLSITNMICVNCQAHVKETLETQPGVESAEVNWEKGEAIVKLKPGATLDEDAARLALDRDNYKLTECKVAS